MESKVYTDSPALAPPIPYNFKVPSDLQERYDRVRKNLIAERIGPAEDLLESRKALAEATYDKMKPHNQDKALKVYAKLREEAWVSFLNTEEEVAAKLRASIAAA